MRILMGERTSLSLYCAIILFDENRMSVYDVNNENELKCSCHVAPLLTTPTSDGFILGTEVG